MERTIELGRHTLIKIRFKSYDGGDTSVKLITDDSLIWICKDDIATFTEDLKNVLEKYFI